MSQALPTANVVYPDSDGEPMADNTLQWETIAYLVSALKLWFRDRLDVFVAGDLLWYFQEGDETKRVAPDGLVAFGRPQGYRGSYRTWEEDGVVPQVVFEVLSPNNTRREMLRKYALYAELGCSEYYLIDPYEFTIEGFVVRDGSPTFVEDGVGHLSAQLGLRLAFQHDRFALFTTTDDKIPSLLDAVDRADAESQRADAESQRADAESQRADAESQRADAETERFDAVAAESHRLRRRLIELGVDPDALGS
jgi:Uma2 family endonuclease